MIVSAALDFLNRCDDWLWAEGTVDEGIFSVTGCIGHRPDGGCTLDIGNIPKCRGEGTISFHGIHQKYNLCDIFGAISHFLNEGIKNDRSEALVSLITFLLSAMAYSNCGFERAKRNMINALNQKDMNANTTLRYEHVLFENGSKFSAGEVSNITLSVTITKDLFRKVGSIMRKHNIHPKSAHMLIQDVWNNDKFKSFVEEFASRC